MDRQYGTIQPLPLVYTSSRQLPVSEAKSSTHTGSFAFYLTLGNSLLRVAHPFPSFPSSPAPRTPVPPYPIHPGSHPGPVPSPPHLRHSKEDLPCGIQLFIDREFQQKSAGWKEPATGFGSCISTGLLIELQLYLTILGLTTKSLRKIASKVRGYLLQPIKSAALPRSGWVATRLLRQSFRVENSGGVAKCRLLRLFSQAG